MNIKKILSTVLTFNIALVSVPATYFTVASADNISKVQYGNGYSTISYVSDDSQVTITGFEIVETEFIIPETINGLPVTRIVGNNESEQIFNIETISIPDTIVTCELYLTCTQLTSITIPDSVQNLVLDCSNLQTLTTVEIGEGVKSLTECSFRNCSSLENVLLPDNIAVEKQTFFNTPLVENQKGVIYIGNWAVDCDNTVENISLNNNTCGISNGAFENCDKLVSIIIPEGVTKLESTTFRNCTSLKKVVMPESLVQIYPSTFAGCISLEEITFSTELFEISDTLEDTLYYKNQKGLKYANSKTIIGCDSEITAIEIPDGVTKINEYAFQNNSDLEEISFPDSLRSIGDLAFGGTKIYNNESNEVYINNWCIKADNNIEQLKIKDGTIGIASNAVNSNKIKEIMVPDGVKYISNNSIYVNNCNIYLPESLEFIEGIGIQIGSNNTIYGYKNTIAEKYAKENNISFVDLDTGIQQSVTTTTIKVPDIIDYSTTTTMAKETNNSKDIYFNCQYEYIPAEIGFNCGVAIAGYDDDKFYEVGNSPIEFTMDDENIAKISRIQGLDVNIIGVSVGETTLNAKSPDGRTASIKVIVTEAPSTSTTAVWNHSTTTTTTTVENNVTEELPQTGIPYTRAVEGIAVLLTLGGATLIIKSRKENDET